MKRYLLNIILVVSSLAVISACDKEPSKQDYTPGIVYGTIDNMLKTKAVISPEGTSMKLDWEVGDAVEIYSYALGVSFTYTVTSLSIFGEGIFQGEEFDFEANAPFLVSYPAGTTSNNKVQYYRGPGNIPNNQYMFGSLEGNRFVLTPISILHLRLIGSGTVGRIEYILGGLTGPSTILYCDREGFEGGVPLSSTEATDFYLSMQGLAPTDNTYELKIYGEDGHLLKTVSGSLNYQTADGDSKASGYVFEPSAIYVD